MSVLPFDGVHLSAAGKPERGGVELLPDLPQVPLLSHAAAKRHRAQRRPQLGRGARHGVGDPVLRRRGARGCQMQVLPVMNDVK